MLRSITYKVVNDANDALNVFVQMVSIKLALQSLRESRKKIVYVILMTKIIIVIIVMITIVIKINNNNNNNNNNTYIAPISILLFSSALKNKNTKKIKIK